ncbi:type III-B CRISPR-associated protein Cas10/Cmr2 [Parageobacillus thermoglucosidasius]|uniref:type III-B CRISPR-associated protein Cas10/Cmr2 n=1 Tax=Parageobacillus thermoglucosidasius TaxID=1426 RepID=UPI000B5684C6|nr:type III-B CRISPR-associated protein Cas10/Cmr2 [Parageobacillus thermoglucosidasius]MBY6269756.1 type III-B CRISPR-associated protein Cas10/Cmr2 [Parageobacillus thermoglucosidasius]MED4905581.1 type III-B CRISPR-associated protein Cas10/Cmr2 [Parageobacillus thermoglucosidasius]MED4913967.1 type III-B CRISPR-associated protein Cas10/Cmr2 [Parageobacillus thermoglucosidasius]MED4945798.1 type III-B CRISPR-associated protein Cas10/Cmr2 [Parageobacillus thermoglucosidasius]MED4981273.1 type 
MSGSLLYVTIGPVQSFIQQARKTQDLYIGSLLLSHLSRIGMNFVQKKYNATIIFPNPDNESVPNRFIANIPANQPIDEIGIMVEKHIKEEFIRIGDNLLKKLSISITESLKKSYFRQLETHLQIFWVALPFEIYHESYAQIEALMGQVKNVRPFLQLDEQGRKCGLTGEHNVLFYRNSRIDKEGKRKFFIPEEAIPLNEKGYLPYIREGEYLGALGFLKRFAFLDEAFEKVKVQFPSTAKIAMLHLLKKEEIHNPCIDYLYVFDQLNENAPTNEIDEKQEKESKKLFYRLKESKVKVCPYYAVIIFDGDSMGKWFGGEKLVHKEQLERFQQSFTTYLGEFAKWARNCCLIEPKGKTVYAGGDDFFGFVNLYHLFEVMNKLRKGFDVRVNQKLRQEFELTEQLTFTAGICIGHYKEPLADIINEARWAEELGKKVKGKGVNEQDKDSFGMSVMKRNGENLISVFKWNTVENDSTPELLNNILSYMNSYFSDTFVQVLAQQFRTFDRKLTGRVLEAELRRLLQRSLINKKEHQEKVNEMVDLLMKLWKASNYLPDLKKKSIIAAANNRTFLNFINMLHTLVFIKQEQSGRREGFR